jgi:hypothetical protein
MIVIFIGDMEMHEENRSIITIKIAFWIFTVILTTPSRALTKSRS